MASRLFRTYFWAVVMLGVVYFIDIKTGFEVSVFCLYAFPTAYAAYHGGRIGGLLFAALCIATWRYADTVDGHGYSQIWIGWERSLNGFVMLATIAFSFDFFKRTRLKDQQRLRELESILPICHVCHRIKSPQGSWVDFESNLRRHLKHQHDPLICPDCADAKYMTDNTL